MLFVLVIFAAVLILIAVGTNSNVKSDDKVVICIITVLCGTLLACIVGASASSMTIEENDTITQVVSYTVLNDATVVFTTESGDTLSYNEEIVIDIHGSRLLTTTKLKGCEVLSPFKKEWVTTTLYLHPNDYIEATY